MSARTVLGIVASALALLVGVAFLLRGLVSR